MKKELNSNPCPELPKCSFQKDILDTAAGVIKKMYCHNNYQNCSRYLLFINGKTVPDNLWPSGKYCTQCKP